jgi:hypothetical protein
MGYVDTLWDINITNITNIEKNMDFTSEIHGGFHENCWKHDGFHQRNPWISPVAKSSVAI